MNGCERSALFVPLRVRTKFPTLNEAFLASRNERMGGMLLFLHGRKDDSFERKCYDDAAAAAAAAAACMQKKLDELGHKKLGKSHQTGSHDI